jgi:hypothetical protein
MATSLKLRRGTTSQHASFTGSAAEVTVDTDKNTVVVHNGSTAGGIPLAKETNPTINGNVTTTGLNFDSNTFVIDATNNRVGIGTASPALALDVNGVTRSSGNFNPANSNWALAAFRAQGAFGGGLSLIDGSAGYGMWSQDAGGTLAIGQGSTSGALSERMRIDSSGNVGIGTSSPSAVGSYRVLDINGTSGGYIGLYTSATKTGAVYSGGDGLGFESFGASRFMNFYTNNAERMRIDSSGRLGVGTTSPQFRMVCAEAGTGVTSTFAIRAGEGGSGSTSNIAQLYFRIRGGGPGDVDGYTQYLYDGANYVSRSDFVGGYQWYVNGTERMRLDASGKLQLGTTTSSGAMQTVYGSTEGQTIYQNATTGTGAGNGLYVGISGADALLYSYENGVMVFGTNSAERMRIASNGRVGINTTTHLWDSSERLTVLGSSIDAIAAWKAGASGTGQHIFLNSSGGLAGYINWSGTSTSYLTSSDYRLKENVVPMTGALAAVAQLKPVTYIWKTDGSSGQGFIAHELQEVVPDCVTGEKDAVETYIDEDGVEQTRPKYQGIDTSFLVATLTAAIQEQQAIINDLKARIETLESK